MKTIKLFEAFLYQSKVDAALKLAGFEPADLNKIGEGDNGIAFRKGDRTIKVTSDADEAEFAGIINGHKLNCVANVYEVYEYDSGSGEDNRNTQVVSGARYYWVIEKDYLPYNGGDSYYYDALLFFDKYQTKNFDYSAKDFDRMIKDYTGDDDPEEEHVEMVSNWFEFYKSLHLELKPLGILSVSDMKEANLGADEDGPKFIELHVFKGNPPAPKFKILKA